MGHVTTYLSTLVLSQTSRHQPLPFVQLARAAAGEAPTFSPIVLNAPLEATAGSSSTTRRSIGAPAALGLL